MRLGNNQSNCHRQVALSVISLRYAYLVDNSAVLHYSPL